MSGGLGPKGLTLGYGFEAGNPRAGQKQTQLERWGGPAFRADSGALTFRLQGEEGQDLAQPVLQPVQAPEEAEAGHGYPRATVAFLEGLADQQKAQ